MSEQRFSDNEPSSNASLPLSAATERMTEDEARAVIELWQSRQDASVLSALPSVPDVAEGLGITPQEASGLLTEVREQRQMADAQRPIETLDESGIQIGRAIEAGRLAARREQDPDETEQTEKMRMAEASISVGQIVKQEQREDLSQTAITVTVIVILLFALVIGIHFLR